MKYKVGTKLICVKNFIMDDYEDDENIAYTKEKIYTIKNIQPDGDYNIPSDLYEQHDMSSEYLDEYFVPARIFKLERILK